MKNKISKNEEAGREREEAAFETEQIERWGLEKEFLEEFERDNKK